MVRVGGFVLPRSELAFSVAYSSGRELSGLPSRFETYAAVAQIQYRITQWMVASAGYYLSSYWLPGGASGLPGGSSTFDQGGVRAGIVVMLPLYGTFATGAGSGD
jgi:hypothetical protein